METAVAADIRQKELRRAAFTSTEQWPAPHVARHRRGIGATGLTRDDCQEVGQFYRALSSPRAQSGNAPSISTAGGGVAMAPDEKKAELAYTDVPDYVKDLVIEVREEYHPELDNACLEVVFAASNIQEDGEQCAAKLQIAPAIVRERDEIHGWLLVNPQWFERVDTRQTKMDDPHGVNRTADMLRAFDIALCSVVLADEDTILKTVPPVRVYPEVLARYGARTKGEREIEEIILGGTVHEAPQAALDLEGDETFLEPEPEPRATEAEMNDELGREPIPEARPSEGPTEAELEEIAEELLGTDDAPEEKFEALGFELDLGQCEEALKERVVRCIGCGVWVFPEGLNPDGHCEDCAGGAL